MRNKRNVFVIIVVIVLCLTGLFTWYRYGFFGHHLFLVKTKFSYLPGWDKDNHGQALAAFHKSCVTISRLDPKKSFSDSIVSCGKVAQWQKICLAAKKIDAKDDLSARKLFEYFFEPYHVYDNFNSRGLFTGYYLPTLNCSLVRNTHYTVPIYATPNDLIRVDLGMFANELKGKVIIGQMKNNQLYPYPTRAMIAKGNIEKNTKVLAWCDNKIDVVFAQIQGSAIIRLPDKKEFLIGYASTNGHPYNSIARVLINNGYLDSDHSSLQSIKKWLLLHPEKSDDVLNMNAAYVFFRVLNNNEPFGCQQQPLTVGRSLAIDKFYLPMNVPVWLDTKVIKGSDGQKIIPFRRLLIAQDTGSAIKGIVRGDVYWGSGEESYFIAGHMKYPGSYWILLPRKFK